MIVEKSFGTNDWIVLISIAIIWFTFFRLPKRFPKQLTILIMLFGLTIASIFDSSFGAVAFDYYDIMDGPAYTLMDVAVYFLYPPFAYFFYYVYRSFNFKSNGTMIYIFIWSIFSVLVEKAYTYFNVFHYKNGYNIYFSFCIYLFVQSGMYLFAKRLDQKNKHLTTGEQ